MENTKNLGLKKWDGGDRILHSEFNDNWDKIDRAMLGKLGKAEKIGVLHNEISNSAAGRIDLSGIDWGSYQAVVLSAADICSKLASLLKSLKELGLQQQPRRGERSTVPADLSAAGGQQPNRPSALYRRQRRYGHSHLHL